MKKCFRSLQTRFSPIQCWIALGCHLVWWRIFVSIPRLPVRAPAYHDHPVYLPYRPIAAILSKYPERVAFSTFDQQCFPVYPLWYARYVLSCRQHLLCPCVHLWYFIYLLVYLNKLNTAALFDLHSSFKNATQGAIDLECINANTWIKKLDHYENNLGTITC